MEDQAAGYWYARALFKRALAGIYLAAFVCAANQFVPLLGEHGLLPVPRFLGEVRFSESPSVFFLIATDRAFLIAAWAGIALSLLALTGYVERWGSVGAGAVWASLWLLYLSFVNVGQTFYAFGWETLLLEAGFLTIFAGGRTAVPGRMSIALYRWVLFRLMFGAGLIKMRGDPCWRDLTCLDFYFETQPMPNPLSWYFHWLPSTVHHGGVIFNHIAELVVPFGYAAPQPVAAIAGLLTIVFQLTLIVSGNLSWLNWLTIVLAIPTLHDRWLSWLPFRQPALSPAGPAGRTVQYALTAVVLFLSIAPVLNMLSPDQLMNYSFEPLHLVNTYGAFGSITKVRGEIIVEGTDERDLTDRTSWREYEFRGKPGDPFRLPPQVAPYHLRLDWLMWFAAMSPPEEHPWFPQLLTKLLKGDRTALGLLRVNPFPDHPPRYVRARYYRYVFTTPEERRRTGRWWTRDLVGLYYPPVALRGS
jgi:hypothetical protein